MAEILVDSWSEIYYSAAENVNSTGITAVGQSFTAIEGALSSCKFYLLKIGAPTGNAVAKLYAHTGTYGVNGVPTGSALAVSDNLDVSTLVNLQLYTFTFSGANQYPLVNGTKYCIVMEYSGGDGSNYVMIGTDAVTIAHSGNKVTYISNWQAWESETCFYVYILSTALEQEGFQFRADDDDEDEATPLANQDIGITRAKGLNTRLRFLINGILDPTAKQFQLEYRKKGVGNWKKIN